MKPLRQRLLKFFLVGGNAAALLMYVLHLSANEYITTSSQFLTASISFGCLPLIVAIQGVRSSNHLLLGGMLTSVYMLLAAASLGKGTVQASPNNSGHLALVMVPALLILMTMAIVALYFVTTVRRKKPLTTDVVLWPLC